MSGLRFEIESPVVAAEPNRADIACLVGFVGRRGTTLPAPVTRWLRERRYLTPPHSISGMVADLPLVHDLLDIPVPIDTWEVFDQLFAWDRRDLNGRGLPATSYLGAAVRSYFAQGGRKCYVVRVGDPPPLSSADGEDTDASHAERTQRIDQALRGLIPGIGDSAESSPDDPTSWHGVGHLFGLPDVSFLCLPDLPDVVGVPPQKLPAPQPPVPAATWSACSQPEPAEEERSAARFFVAPRCDQFGYEQWAAAVRSIATLLARHQRELQLIAAVPIPQADLGIDGLLERSLAQDDLLGYLNGNGMLSNGLDDDPADPDTPASGFASAFVQLAYPWLRTPGSQNLPEQLESPDGVLAGLLARNALARGAFRSAANSHLADVYDVFPILSSEQLQRVVVQPRAAARGLRSYALPERLSLFAPTPSGLRLLSDVTTSLDESYRQASVNRLVSTIVRAARRLGEDVVFESNDERLWSRLTEHLEDLLLRLLAAGALRGTTPAEAFQVRCDRSTMTENDIDSGRVIAEVQFTAAATIEQITVVLAMNEGGQVSLVSTQRMQPEAV